MGIANKIKALFSNVEKFVDVKLEDGIRIFHQEGEELTIGESISEILEDMTTANVEDGEYKIEDGRSLVIKDNLLESIIEADAAESENETEANNVTIDLEKTIIKFAVIKQISKWEMTVNNETFEVGSTVKGTSEDGSEYTAYSGTYELEDGRLITLNDEGVIVLVQDAVGTVESTVAVGDKLEGESSTDSVETSLEEEAFEKVKRTVEEFENLKVKYSKLEEDFKKLSESPSAEPLKSKIDFKATTPKNPTTWGNLL